MIVASILLGIAAVAALPREEEPIMAVTFWGEGVDHCTLRRVAAEAEDLVKREPNACITGLIGGEGRQVEVRLDPVRLAACGLDGPVIAAMLAMSNAAPDTGGCPSPGGQIVEHTDGLLKSAREVSQVVVKVEAGKPVTLGDVAAIADGPPEPGQYVFFGTGPAAGDKGLSVAAPDTGAYPAVTLTAAKRKGTNAIEAARRALARLEDARGTVIPDDIRTTVTRHCGETAKEKSDELLLHMLIAIVSLTVLIWSALGHRESGIVALAIPVTLALTLAVFYVYTVNEVTDWQIHAGTAGPFNGSRHAPPPAGE